MIGISAGAETGGGQPRTSNKPFSTIERRSPLIRKRPFTYMICFSLAKRQIHLCTIHPGAFDESLRCILRTVSLDEEPKYETLSYVWGEPIIDHAISVDGSVLMIHQKSPHCSSVPSGPRTPPGFLRRDIRCIPRPFDP
jgi:hypothetical protein